MSDEHQFKGQHVVKTVGPDAPEPAAAPPTQAQPGSPAHAADKNLALGGQPPRRPAASRCPTRGATRCRSTT
jgi:hypothetical protein